MTWPKHARTEAINTSGRAIRGGPRVAVESWPTTDDPGAETQNLSRFLLPGAESTSARLRELTAELDAMRTNRNNLSAELDATRRELEAALDAADAAQQRVNELTGALTTERGRAAVGDRRAVVVAVSDAWMCLRANGGCAARFDRPEPGHYCGRLTPIRHTITERTEETPTT